MACAHCNSSSLCPLCKEADVLRRRSAALSGPGPTWRECERYVNRILLEVSEAHGVHIVGDTEPADFDSWAAVDPRVTMESTTRKRAEENIRMILEAWDEPDLALLFQLLRASGWSTDRARMVLEKAKWAL